MGHQQGQGGAQLDAEIPVRNGVQAVEGKSVKPQGRRRHAPVYGICGAGQGAGAQGGDVHPPGGVLQPADVPGQHHPVSQQMMSQSYGLGPLQVCVSGHDRVGVFLGLGNNGGDQALDQGDGFFGFLPKIKPCVGRHLVIPAAGCMQLFARVAQPVDKRGLDKGVDILGGGVDWQGTVFDIAKDAGKAVYQRLALRFRDNAALCQHPCMGDAPRDVLTEHAAVYGD